VSNFTYDLEKNDMSAVPQPPHGCSRILYRAPIWLYRLGLGFLLGQRFLLLNHVGRQSGKARQAVLEVAHYLPEQSTYIVASGFGFKSDWYLNLRAKPQVTIQVGRRQTAVTADFLPAEASGEQMVNYYRRHPTAARNLARLLGVEVADNEEAYRKIGQERIPFVAFRPR
jgi:deazaflavin-dependent oxidoreductase (nitroreductase family)